MCKNRTETKLTFAKNVRRKNVFVRFNEKVHLFFNFPEKTIVTCLLPHWFGLQHAGIESMPPCSGLVPPNKAYIKEDIGTCRKNERQYPLSLYLSCMDSTHNETSALLENLIVIFHKYICMESVQIFFLKILK